MEKYTFCNFLNEVLCVIDTSPCGREPPNGISEKMPLGSPKTGGTKLARGVRQADRVLPGVHSYEKNARPEGKGIAQEIRY